LQSVLNNGNSNRSVISISISISMFYSSIFDYVLYSFYVLFSLLITLSYSCSCSFFLHQQLLSYWHYGLWALLRGSTLQQALLLLHHTTRHARVETVDRLEKSYGQVIISFVDKALKTTYYNTTSLLTSAIQALNKRQR
jgi:hypothetical protein